MPEIAAFDSSAALSVLLSEPGQLIVAPFLKGGLLSTVNVAEVHARLLRRGTANDLAWEEILDLDCELIPFTPEQARIAAELIPITRPFGLSLGDRACLALAIERKARVYTTDRAWASLSLGIEIEVIR